MATTSISVKWFHQGEFRRFGVDLPSSGVKAYEALLYKIQAMAPNPHFEGIFAWKDKDGDLITFASDEELKEALRHVTDNVLRIFTVVREKDGRLSVPQAGRKEEEKKIESPVETKKDEQEQKQEQTGPKEHPGVMCDGCDSALRGIRYKCVVCRDYDLCGSCEAKQLHNEHAMIRIADPNDRSWRPLLMWGRHFPPPPFGPHGPCGPHGHPHGPWGRGRRCGGRGRWQRPEGEAGAPNQTENPQSPEFDFAQTGAQFLRQVGEQVAAALGTLGIDVDIDVEHEGQRENVGGKNKDESKPEQPTQPTPPKEGTLDQAVGGAPLVPERVIPIQVADPLAAPPSAPPTTEHTPREAEGPLEWTLLDRPNTEEQRQVPPPMPPMAPGFPSFPPASFLQHPGLYPSGLLPPSAQPPAHPGMSCGRCMRGRKGKRWGKSSSDPRVNRALEQMMAMGFSNEGGWLTQLLELKQGDICAALDALKPHRL